MRNIKRTFSVAAFALALTLTGCSAGTSASTGSAGSTGQSGTSSVSGIQTVTAASVSEDTHYDADDQTWDAAKEVAVTLKDGASTVAGSAAGVAVDGDTVTITSAGTYRLSGALSNGKVVVAAGEEDVVRIILDGVTLANSTGSPFVIQSANEAILFLEDGTSNSLKDAATYADQADDAPNAALYSMADLTLAGTGALEVNGQYNDGIVSKDGLVLASGNVTVKAVDDGIRGKDYAVLLDGAYQVTAGGDGFISDNDTDDGRGWVPVNGGKLALDAGDDGVQAQNQLAITNGTVTVAKSEEGLEAQHIAVSGGTVNVTANDDGVNASGGSSSSSQPGSGAQAGGMGGGPGGGGESVGDYSVDISGGSLTINSQGDGLDSNGNATVSGGTVVVNGPETNGNGALDVNGELAVSGGTLAAAGSSGMAVAPGSSSTQSGVQVTFGSTVPAGTAIQLTDAEGKLVATFVTTKSAASLVFSSAAIKAGEVYTVYTGGTAKVGSGLGEGSLDGAEKVSTVTAGEYTTGHGPGAR